MKKITISINDTNYVRISKTLARNLYAKGKELLIAPSKVNLNSPWAVYNKIKGEENFDNICNTFEYYNCSEELGTYIAFYVDQTECKCA